MELQSQALNRYSSFAFCTTLSRKSYSANTSAIHEKYYKVGISLNYQTNRMHLSTRSIVDNAVDILGNESSSFPGYKNERTII